MKAILLTCLTVVGCCLGTQLVPDTARAQWAVMVGPGATWSMDPYTAYRPEFRYGYWGARASAPVVSRYFNYSVYPAGIPRKRIQIRRWVEPVIEIRQSERRATESGESHHRPATPEPLADVYYRAQGEVGLSAVAGMRSTKTALVVSPW